MAKSTTLQGNQLRSIELPFSKGVYVKDYVNFLKDYKAVSLDVHNVISMNEVDRTSSIDGKMIRSIDIEIEREDGVRQSIDITLFFRQ